MSYIDDHDFISIALKYYQYSLMHSYFTKCLVQNFIFYQQFSTSLLAERGKTVLFKFCKLFGDLAITLDRLRTSAELGPTYAKIAVKNARGKDNSAFLSCALFTAGRMNTIKLKNPQSG